jgi:prolyl oligopeptidase
MQILQTKKEDVLDDVCGISVADPYRWLENGDNEDVKKWVTEQNQYINSFLRNESQKKFSDELVKDFNVVDFSNLLPVKGHYFYTERQPGEDHAVLYIKDGLKGVPTRLIGSPDGQVII